MPDTLPTPPDGAATERPPCRSTGQACHRVEPGAGSGARQGPPSWASVAPLIARWQMALVPLAPGTWHVLPNYPHALALPRHLGETAVPFEGLPQAIADVAARCEATAALAAGEEEA